MPLTREYFAQQAGRYKVKKKDEEALGLLLDRWELSTSEATKYAFERQWFVNLAFYAGVQNVSWNHISRRLEEPPAPSWRRRYVANLILPMVQRSVAKLTAERPRTVVVPNSPERDDVNSATVATKVLEHLYTETKIDDVVRDVAMWGALCGTGYFKVHWDPDRGPRISDVLGGDVKDALSAEKQRTEEKLTSDRQDLDLRLGEVAMEAVSPFKIYTDAPTPSVDWKDATWVIEGTERPLDYIRERWDNGKFVTAESSERTPGGWWERRLSNLVGPTGVSSASGQEDKTDSAVVLEMWEKPGPTHPRGRYVVAANGVILDNRVNVYADELNIWNPYIPWHYIEMPGRHWGISLVENLIAPQREYNIARSQIIESKNLMSKPKWVVPKGAGIPDTALTSEPGEVVEYNPNFPPPQPVQPAPLPAYVEQHINDIVREMQMIASQSDVTQARAPGSVRSGVAIQLLMEQDESVMSLPRNRLVDAVVRASEFALRLAGINWTEGRIVKTLSKDSEYKVESFTGADLRNNYDVRVVPSTGRNESAAARRQNIMELIQLGVLQPQNPTHSRAILESFELADADTGTKRVALHERVAEYENTVMAGDPPEVPGVDAWHDHQVHVEVLDSYMNSSQFRELMPEQQEIFKAHRAAHVQILQSQMQAQMEMEMSMRGGPGEKGKPSIAARREEAPDQP